MQLIVVGMHRSGTSAVTRLLNMAGAYFGPEGVATAAERREPEGLLGTSRRPPRVRWAAPGLRVRLVAHRELRPRRDPCRDP